MQVNYKDFVSGELLYIESEGIVPPVSTNVIVVIFHIEYFIHRVVFNVSAKTCDVMLSKVFQR